jgi:amidase
MRRSQMMWLAAVLGRELVADDLSIPIVTEEMAASVSAAEFVEAQETIAREMLALNSWWDDEGHDLLVTPVLRQPAWPLGSKGDVLDSGAFLAPYSFSGQPALSLPLHHGPRGTSGEGEGLPVGVQIVAARGREDLLLQVAAQLEEAAPWADRWPAISIGPSAHAREPRH